MYIKGGGYLFLIQKINTKLKTDAFSPSKKTMNVHIQHKHVLEGFNCCMLLLQF